MLTMMKTTSEIQELHHVQPSESDQNVSTIPSLNISIAWRYVLPRPSNFNPIQSAATFTKSSLFSGRAFHMHICESFLFQLTPSVRLIAVGVTLLISSQADQSIDRYRVEVIHNSTNLALLPCY